MATKKTTENKEEKTTTRRTRRKKVETPENVVPEKEKSGDATLEESTSSVEPEEEKPLTPSEYFEHVKNLKESITDGGEQLKTVLELVEKEMKKFKILKQTEAAKSMSEYAEMLTKEIKIIEAGFQTYVNRKDVEYFMTKISQKCVYCCEIADYPRPVPNEIFEKIENHIDLFDHLFIVFTDYTGKEARKIDQKTREKDPIMFGAVNLGSQFGRNCIGPRMYFIGDWVDEYCELTLVEMIDECAKRGRKDIKHELAIPTNQKELIRELKNYQDAFVNDTNLTLSVPGGDSK